ncbi:MAG: tetratricopeptide repeat protein [Cytophagales bacterium]|nr:tetratricopeptide repeat protein [Cytophagales bacterium]
MKGNVLFKQKKYEEAVNSYNKAIELQPNEVAFKSFKQTVEREISKCRAVIHLLDIKDVSERVYKDKEMSEALQEEEFKQILETARESSSSIRVPWENPTLQKLLSKIQSIQNERAKEAAESVGV